MNATRFLIPALLASPLLLALEPRGEGITFHPSEDSSLTKHTQLDLSFEIGDLSMIVNGNDMSGQVPADVSGAMTMAMTWTDKYVKLDGKDGNKPLELIRSYDEMSGKMDMNGGGESDSNDIPEVDALVGKSIKFKWNDEKKEYDVTYHECEGEENLLKTQQVDMDFRMMLPTKEVAVGDKWEVQTDFIRQMLDALKNNDMGGDEAGIQAILEDQLFPQMEKLLEKFKTTCEYKGHRDQDGVDVAVIAVNVEGKGDLDFKSMLEALIEEQISKVGQEVNFEISKAMLNLSMTGKGEVLWDVKSGHIYSTEQSADFTVNIGFDASFEAGGQSQAIEAEVEIPGKFSTTTAVKS